MGESLFGTESSFRSEPVLHVMAVGSAVVLVVQVSADSHIFSGRRKNIGGGRWMSRMAIGGFGGGFRRSGSCVLFHGTLMFPSRRRSDNGVNAHCVLLRMSHPLARKTAHHLPMGCLPHGPVIHAPACCGAKASSIMTEPILLIRLDGCYLKPLPHQIRDDAWRAVALPASNPPLESLPQCL